LIKWGATKWPPIPPQRSERPGGAGALLYHRPQPALAVALLYYGPQPPAGALLYSNRLRVAFLYPGG
jgi:hypothetical protein